jgi:predicted aspartyl protease
MTSFNLRSRSTLSRFTLFLLTFSVSAVCSATTQSDAVLRHAREAAGGAAWEKVTTLDYQGTEDQSGMKGPIHIVEDVSLGRISRKSDFGIIKFAEVWDGRNHWRQDMTGGVHLLNSHFALQANATDQWLARRGYLKPGADGAAFGPVEQRTNAAKSYDVISATPVGGQPVELWFDAATGLLARSVRIMPITVETANYGDYKSVAGVVLPHTIVTDEGPGQDPDTVTISHYEVNAPVNDRTFAALTTPDDTTVTGGKTTIPVETEGYVTLEARLNGKGPFAFIFDTGGHAILTPEAVAALGLSANGAGSSGGTGSDQLSVQYTKVDRMEIGGATLKDQRFLVIPLQYDTTERGGRPALAGILGLELLERLSARLDYRHQTLTFWPRQSYRHSGPGTSVPITFADDIPLVPAKIGRATGDFALDTGNSASVLVQHVWAEKNGLADEMKRGVKMVSFGSGGASQNWASRVDNFEVAGDVFHHAIARYAEDKEGSLSSRTEAGNIGNDILQHFTLDFDYANNLIWFEPVPGFTPLPFPRSGMSFYKQSATSVVIVNTVPGGPADKAGLKEGDALLTIAGEKTTAWSRDRLMKYFRQPVGTRVPVTYSRKGNEASTVITLEDLLP